MNNHLSEDQITEWLLGARDEDARRHLEACGACSLEVEELRRSISGFRDSVHAAAERDQSFWRNQQLAISDRVRAKGWYPLHWAWVAAMVMVLMAAVLLMRSPNSRPDNATEDADKALLQEVQADLSREVPQALAPAVLIAEERNEILSNKDTQPTKSQKRREIK